MFNEVKKIQKLSKNRVHARAQGGAMPLGPYCTIGAPGVLIQQWHPLVFLNFKSVFM